MKKIIVIGCLLSALLILTGCYDKGNMVTNEIEGTLMRLELGEVGVYDNYLEILNNIY